ncbi:MAG TPA: alpha/beta fold hydrolase [Thermoanaerobaculia bacterium]|nr:alpha/beta fold hydrolase [Thermoanaerobaculia bacterium]
MKRNSSTLQIVRFPRRHRLRRVGKGILKGVFRLFGRIAPSLAAERAETLFRTPPKCAKTRFERNVLEEGTLSYVDGPAGRLATYRWGAGPAVLLVHGWGGHAGRLARFVSPLTAAGFSVVAFDAPGHGSSDRTLCSLPEIAESVRALAAEIDPFGVVGHSLGATAAALAARDGVRFRRAVFLAPAATPENYPGRFGRFLGMPEEGCDFMKRRLLRRYSIRWNDVSVVSFASAMTARLLVYHDERDTRVPFREGRAIAAAWPDARLVPMRGVGHHRILRAPEVIAGTVEFLAAAAIEIPLQPESARAS